jgi:hypothetical protein
MTFALLCFSTILRFIDTFLHAPAFFKGMQMVADGTWCLDTPCRL